MNSFLFYPVRNRIILLSIFLVLLPNALPAQVTLLQSRLEKVIEGKDATVGIAVKASGEKALVINNGHSYSTMSVYKFHLALAILDSLSRANLPLDRKIKVKKKEMLENTYSPMKKKYPKGGTIKISELLHYSVSLSDNNACDILFRFMGGTHIVDQYIRSLGIEDFRIGATEEEMHKEYRNQELNWTTPLAGVELMDIFLNRNLFQPVYKEFLYELLIKTETGADKLKEGLPSGVLLGHKTGSSFRSEEGVKLADNDLGFVQLPDGRFYTIAVFVKDSREEDKVNAAIIAEASRVVYEVYEEGMEDVYVSPEPDFPGGIMEALKFINKKTMRPPIAHCCEQPTGRVVIGFVVEKDGSLTNLKVVRSVKFLDEEALEVVRSMPSWKPGTIKGENVRTWYLIPVTYRLH